MITSLRSRHRIIVTSLALLVPVMFVSGLIARRPFPVSSRLPAIQSDPASEEVSVIYEDRDLWKGLAVTARIMTANGNSPTMLLELQATHDLAEPDLLVYWGESRPSPDRPAGSAVLLGRLSGTRIERLPLSARALSGTGYLTLYSLAHAKTIATSELSVPALRTKGDLR
ncbi:MAG TPA: hypothetical protein VJ302_21520 [Blastocatellia bacterium]|nr:hypothetical protein [Blastocatellia bacterium]